MKPALFFVCMMLSSGGTRAQTPSPAPSLPLQNPTAPQGPVPLTEEPHHRLVLQNDFTRVYNVTVPALDATLLHQHDHPYLYVVLGPAEIINAIVGKPELHQTLQDGETHFTPGNFAHVARTDFGLPFRNVTIELLRPQGTTKNLCKPVLAAESVQCPPQQAAAPAVKGKKNEPEPADDDVPYFESDEIRVDLFKVSSGRDYVDTTPKTSALLVALTEANLDINLGGEHLQFLHSGDVVWLPAGQHRRVVDFLGTRSSFLLIAFKDATPTPSTP